MSTPSIYKDGTLSAVKGEVAFTGTGTAWSTQLKYASVIFARVSLGGSPEEFEWKLLGIVSAVSGDAAGTLVEPSEHDLTEADYIAITGNSGAEIAEYIRLLMTEQAFKGMTKNISGAPDAADFREHDFVRDRDTNMTYIKDEGVMVALTQVLAVSASPWEGVERSERHELSIEGSPAETAIDGDDGPDFLLVVDADTEIQAPTNVEVNDTFSLLLEQDGEFTPTWAEIFEAGTGFSFEDVFSDGRKRARLSITITDETAGVATAATVSPFPFAAFALVTDRDGAYLSRSADNYDEPRVDETGKAISSAGWVPILLPKGDPGSALLTATSTSSIALEAGSKVFTLAEAEERGYALGSYVLAVDAANPTTKYGVGRVTAYAHPSLTLSFAADDIVGSGTIANWILSLTARRGAAGQQPGLLYEFSSTTTEGADAGTVRADNADLSAGGELYIADQDATGEDHSAYWLEAANSTSAVKGFILIKRVQDGKVTQLRVSAAPSDETGYVKFAYTYVSGPTSIAAASQISIKFDEKGDAGDGASEFTGLDDTPANYSGHGLKRVRVNSGATGLEFVEPGAEISGATEKTTPIDADTIGISDSDASGVFKKLTWANVKATLKTYFDTLYLTLTGLFGYVAWNNATEAGGEISFDCANGTKLTWRATATATAEIQEPTNLPDGATCYLTLDPDGETITWAAGYIEPVPDPVEKSRITIVRDGSEYIAGIFHEEEGA